MIGFNVFDYLDLPPLERSIVRVILRQTRITYPDLLSAVSAFPLERRVTRQRLDVTLDTLTRAGWLVRRDKAGQSFYSINTKPRGSSASDLLSTLDTLEVKSLSSDDLDLLLPSKIETNSMRRGGKRSLPTSIWRSLDDAVDAAGTPPTSARKSDKSSVWDVLIDD